MGREEIKTVHNAGRGDRSNSRSPRGTNPNSQDGKVKRKHGSVGGSA